MLDALFGTELSTTVKFLIAFPIILALAVGFLYAVRRLGVGGFGVAVSSRGRQPRLGVTDIAMVGDGRRRLLLIRRDNIEHLVMTGGPTDLVIEANIVRASPAGAMRETPPARAAGDMLPRAVPLPEAGHWPLQPEPVARAQRAAAPLDYEEPDWSAPAEPAPRAVPERDNGGDSVREPARESIRETARESVRENARESVKESAPRGQNSDRLSGLAADLSRNIAEPQAPPPPPRRTAEPQAPPPPPRRTAEPRRTPAPAISPTEERNLAEMAQQLESVLQRPRSGGEPAIASPRSLDTAPPVRSVEAPPARSIDQVRALEAVAVEPVPIRAEARPEPVIKPVPKPAPKVAAKPAPRPAPKAAFDSLEQEMASLLGRPAGKT